MARDHARIYVRIWNDEDFRELSLPAKMLYLQLMSQQKLSYAGVLDLAMKRWAGPHPDLDTPEVRAALDELDYARFVVVDHDTEELLVRTFIRNDELYKQPNVLRGALRVAFDIESPKLRAALAVELRKLPADVTGPAPAFAAAALEGGARELPGEVKAAMTIRGTTRSPASPRRPAGAATDDETSAPAENEPVTASANPSPNPLGEGSRERETGEPDLSLRSKKVGLPPRETRGARVAADAPTGQEVTATESVLSDRPEAGSVRQRRRAEAERLVEFYGSSVPERVRAQLVAQVIPLLCEGIGSNVIGSGLAVWSSKTLPATFLPMLVGERMRAARIAVADPKKRARDVEVVDRFESLRSAAIAEDEQHGLGLAVRLARPQHADADQLNAILDTALEAADDGLIA
ncbi:hypothetical protein [Amycolatopsis sp. NPDC051716]|uniref:hypothetical protein n=1 Tax=Amycolatopsis sp. NPDC051716 TaxID=3155804 RepID=UPI003441C82A